MSIIRNFNGNLGLQIILFSVSLVLFQTMQSELLFHRSSIEQGQFWRILTGNLVHTNLYHLFMNLAGLFLLWLLYHPFLGINAFWLSFLAVMLGVGFGILIYSPTLVWYAGLSGALYGMFIVAASLALRCKNWLISVPVLLLIPSKLIWDLLHGHSNHASAELIGAPIATDAHVYGVACGFMLSVLLMLLLKRPC